MLWLALHFPALAVEVFSRGSVVPQPLAVADRLDRRTRVAACNAAAVARGVRPGMAVSAAQALVDQLVVRERDPQAELEALSGLATWAGRFTPAVSLQPPAGLLLEIGSCLRLHHGLDRLLDQILAGLEAMGYVAVHACAPTPQGAWLLARAGTGAVVRDATQLQQSLAALPLRLLDQPAATLVDLANLGAHNLGDCLRLPRAGLVRRFGRALLDELDRALGRLPEPRAFFVPPPDFARCLELPAPVQEAEALLFAACRLLPELEGYLEVRQAGVQEIELICRHEDAVDTVLRLGFVQPTSAVERMRLLLRETLLQTRLSAQVQAIVLHARRILPLAARTDDLFQAPAQAREEDGNLLLERLRIRLGPEAVYGVASAVDHRPERAWRHCAAGEAAGHAAAAPGQVQRPLWLLPKPLPCPDGLTLKSEPERIESGWWDGLDVARDYYVAQDRKGARLWVYCERASGDWFVHGLFA